MPSHSAAICVYFHNGVNQRVNGSLILIGRISRQEANQQLVMYAEYVLSIFSGTKFIHVL